MATATASTAAEELACPFSRSSRGACGCRTHARRTHPLASFVLHPCPPKHKSQQRLNETQRFLFCFVYFRNHPPFLSGSCVASSLGPTSSAITLVVNSTLDTRLPLSTAQQQWPGASHAGRLGRARVDSWEDFAVVGS